MYVQYVGFHARPLVREYTFSVREGGNEPREYTLTITNEAFTSRRARFQDAPQICFLKLQQELAAGANHPLKTHFRISDSDLDHYRDSHAHKAFRHVRKPDIASF